MIPTSPTIPVARVTAAPHFKPRLSAMLQALGLDVSYERGQGDYLYYRDEEHREIQVLDLVGGYGSLLLGHAHPALVAEAQRLLASGSPNHTQGSRRESAARLARQLSGRARADYCVVFGNSGTEAIEAAIKHAMLETGGRTFIAIDGAFHGKTLGALQLTASSRYREPFELPGLTILRIPANDLRELERAFAAAGDLAGFIFEPILGEGGVRPVDGSFAQAAARLCTDRGIPLIADECQTGMGRTGTFLASEGLGVQPDYVVLSKSLGGGLAKISALLVRRERYRDEFDLKHTSTFAEDDFSCSIALRALDLIDEPLLAACRRKGNLLLSGLRALASRHPEVIAEVRGRGLMVAVEFRRLTGSSSFLLRFLSTLDDLAYVLTGYLLNVHRIRVAPALSDGFSLRLEPSVLIDDGEIARFLSAMDELCRRLTSGDGPGLTHFLADAGASAPYSCRFPRSDAKFMVFDDARFRAREQTAPLTSVAWLCHMIDADHLISLEPSFAGLPYRKREDLLSSLASRAAPVVMSAVDVSSRTGRTVRLYSILLPFTSSWAKQQIDCQHLAAPQALVQRGVDLAAALHCRLVALGQYTSIVTLNGARLARGGIGVTTGNSYAIALAVQAIERAHLDTGRQAGNSTLIVVGASGNIGRTCAKMLAPRYRRTILIGSRKPGSQRRLQLLADAIPRAIISTDLEAVREGDVVVAALNAVDAPLAAGYFARNAIVCDLSVPASLAAGVKARPDLLVITGGIASLPFAEDLEIVGFPLSRGRTYGCMAEALLLGFEGVFDRTFTGTLSEEQVARVAEMADRHGFTLSDYKRACVLGSEPSGAAYEAAR